MRPDPLRTIFLVLAAIALALGIITVVIVFYPAGSYEPVVIKGTPQSPTGNATSALNTASSSGNSSGQPASNSGSTATPFSIQYPAGASPVTWTEGREKFSITAASFQGNQLVISLSIQMGNSPECVPLFLRLVADESGTLKAPDLPVNAIFTFPDTQSCNGKPGANYVQDVSFTIDPGIIAPFSFTTGGASNIFFSAATTTGGGMDVRIPEHSG